MVSQTVSHARSDIYPLQERRIPDLESFTAATNR
jgi:hypothetical protein